MAPTLVTVAPGQPLPQGGPAVPWWSFGKTVIAAAALTLVRDGLAGLDEPIVGDATLADLLQHRAGLSDYGALPAYAAAVKGGERAWPVEVLLAAVDPTVDRLHWRYSNVGYLHVRRWLTARGGGSLDAVLSTRVFAPLGLTRARLAVMPSDLDGVIGVPRTYDPNWVYHGLIVGPLSEAARLLAGLAAGDLLPPVLMEAMRQPWPVGGPMAGRPWRAPAYGLGLMLEQTSPVAFGHTGGGPGSVIAVYHDPAAGITRAAFQAGDDEGAVERATLPAEGGAPVAQTLPEDADGLAAAVLASARARGLRIATAESCTGGLVAAALTAIAGSSDAVDRGFVTYSNEAKVEMLGVDPTLIARVGAVSREVAVAMAEGAVRHSRADLAVAITGIAGPGGGSAEKPVGLVHFACARKSRETLHAARRFGDIGRDRVRAEAVKLALRLLME